MSTPEQLQARENAMIAFAGVVKSKLDEVTALAQNTNASTLENQTLAQITASLKALFQGATTDTTADIKAIAEKAAADLLALTKADVDLGLVVNAGFVDTSAEANYADTVADVYTDPKAVWAIVNKHWANVAGTAPAVLDTINEVAAAIQNNQGTIQSLETIAASKASSQDLTDAVTNLQGQIAAVVADDATFTAGTATDKAASVKQVHDHVATEIAAAMANEVTTETSVFAQMSAIVDPAPLA